MKFVHIMGAGGMYTHDFSKMIAESFDPKNHCFLSRMSDHDNFSVARKNGVEIVNPVSIRAIRILHSCDCIVCHGMINPKNLALYSLLPSLCRKTNWVIWGGDIYHDKDAESQKKASAIDFLRRRIYKRFKWATTLSGEDYAYARKTYGLKAREFEGCYPVPATLNACLVEEAIRAKANKNDGPYVIQVGNSATATNQHMQALDMLSKFKDRDFELFLPLNYGAAGYEHYADEVVDHAVGLFGPNRVIALRERIGGADYLELLSKVDVGVFNNNRQQAMGNISQLILMGAKVYLRKDVSMWKHFESLGCVLNDFDSITQLSFEDFIKEDPEVKEANIAVIKKRHSLEEKVDMWRYIFSEMEKEQS